MKLLAERSGGVYRASAGAIYPILQELEDEGLVTADQQNAERVYRITDEGRQELEREGATVRAIWRRAQRWREWRTAFDPGVAEVVRPAERVVKAAFRAICASTERADRICEILECALRDIETLE